MIDLVFDGLLPGVYLALLLVAVKLIVSRVRFKSENVLDIRNASGGRKVLRLDALDGAAPAQRQKKIEEAVAELA